MKTRKDNRDDVREDSITFPTSPNEKREIQNAANQKGITMSAFVRMAVKEYIEKGANA